MTTTRTPYAQRVDLLIIAAAAHRLNRLWHADTITAPLRARASKLSNPAMNADGTVHIARTARRLWLYELLSCTDCFGFHASWIATALHRSKFTRPLVWALAASAGIGPLYAWDRQARAAAHARLVELGVEDPEPEPADPRAETPPPLPYPTAIPQPSESVAEQPLHVPQQRHP